MGFPGGSNPIYSWIRCGTSYLGYIPGSKAIPDDFQDPTTGIETPKPWGSTPTVDIT